MRSFFHQIPTTLQELSPKTAQFCLKIKNFIESILEKECFGKIVVGCSGGADSIALSLILKCLDIPIIIAHLDHTLRKESVLDAQHVISFAHALSVPFVVKNVDIIALQEKYGTGIEETGRIERYRFLEEVRKDHKAQWIAVGHHLDDLCEDVLLRLIRGTGWPGLAGMKAIDRERYLLRPLLNIRRSILETLLLQEKIPWIEDVSNTNMVFKRNRIRHNILPLIEEENPNFSQSIQRLWLLAKEDEYFWNSVLEDVFLSIQYKNGYYWVSREILVSLPKAARLRVYFKTVQKLCAGHGRSDTFFLLDNAIMHGKDRKCFQFSNGVAVKVHSSGVQFFTP